MHTTLIKIALLVEPDVPLEPIRREHRRGADTPATNAVDKGTAPEKNAKQLEFASFTKPGEGDGGALRENKVLKLKEMKQLLDNDYKVCTFIKFI